MVGLLFCVLWLSADASISLLLHCGLLLLSFPRWLVASPSCCSLRVALSCTLSMRRVKL